MISSVFAVGSGLGLTRLMQWGGKGISDITHSEVVKKITYMVIGFLAPCVINQMVEHTGLDPYIRLLIKTGVIAESVYSGTRLAVQIIRSSRNEPFAEWSGFVSSSLTIMITKNPQKAAHVGFIVPFLVMNSLDK